MDESTSRRTFLQVTLALAGTGAGSAVVAQDEDEPEADIQLVGRTSGWQGVEPDPISDETNPTLTLVEGEDYVLEWSNGDGRPHNFTIEPEDGDDIVSTDILTSGSQIVEFTAEAEMDEYYCQPHPQSMRGSVEIVDDPEAEDAIVPGETDGDDEGSDEQEDDEEELGEDDVEETLELALTEDGWEGRSPDEIDGESDPTLELDAGTVYEIAVTAEIGRADYQPGHNLLLLDDDGREVAHTDFLDEGQEGSVVFTAEENVARYLDQTQLDVGGDVEVTDGESEGDDGSADDEGDDTDGGGDSEGERIGVGAYFERFA